MRRAIPEDTSTAEHSVVLEVHADPNSNSNSNHGQEDVHPKGRPELIDDRSLPDWQAKRPHIISGYRHRYTMRDCVWSCLTLHNETINIWTHLVGGVLWLREGYLFSMAVPPADRKMVALVAFLGSIMFMCSSAAHAFACVSPTAYKLLWKADYAGILLLWYARVVFDSYFLIELCAHGFWISVVVGFAAIFALFGVPVVLHKRMLCFVLLFGLMHVPMIMTSTSPQSANPHIFSFILTNVAATLCGVIGFGIFSVRAPEVWSPGSFDVWFHSHQWWHVLTTAGPLLSWQAGYHLVAFRAETTGCISFGHGIGGARPVANATLL